ncbi:MAG: isoprenylcysteine carboxylmethyltransferase family protein [Candidatus Heimdallarchaeota archaeon]|nr:isoprenylcysteine carboxylmethyltransferase family protein [Candidatus Heimdallarchaeota archaeon]
MPATRSEKIGERAWKESKTLRIIASVFELLFIVNIILWQWYPIPEIDWEIFSTYWWIGLIVFSVIFIPGLIIMIKGVVDAGSETLTPSEENKMYGGIYKHIRHPQTTGEMPMFIAFAFAINSWFLVLYTFVFLIIYIPLIMYFEEKDLVKRFGDDYRKYQKDVGALLPKRRKK